MTVDLARHAVTVAGELVRLTRKEFDLLRQKQSDDPAEPRFIMNEPGVGYRLLTPE